MVDGNERIWAACIYLGVAAFAHLVWEGFQVPLYTLWTSATLLSLYFIAPSAT